MKIITERLETELDTRLPAANYAPLSKIHTLAGDLETLQTDDSPDPKADHEELISAIRTVDRSELTPIDAYGVVFNSRRFAALFVDPIVAQDQHGNLVVADAPPINKWASMHAYLLDEYGWRHLYADDDVHRFSAPPDSEADLERIAERYMEGVD